ncbi:MAG: sensor domain-containing protein [Actinobacteria bacterium]|nr:sensor domain-containing protein [Actinomycetota bacterium]
MFRRVQLVLIAGASIGISAASLVLLLLAVLGAALVVVWVGLPLLFGAAYATRGLATTERRLAAIVVGQRIASPYLDHSGGNLFRRLQSLARDPATWRDAVWLLVNGIAGLVLSIVGLLEALLGVIFWWLPPALLVRINAHISRALLSPGTKSELALRVQHLTQSRADTVDTQAAEIRRIERDLHDGAQARLVALGMTLGLAEEIVHGDPAGAQRLLAEARSANSQALSELRDLVRGIHPPVLADRGLDGAVQALVLSSPIPVQVDIDLPRRLPAPVESAAYFGVAECVTNLIKHSGASKGVVRLRHVEERLHVEVIDDGRGGVILDDAGGLRGIQRRLSAFDGTLAVLSPPGGPTVVVMDVPCEPLSTH